MLQLNMIKVSNKHILMDVECLEFLYQYFAKIQTKSPFSDDELNQINELLDYFQNIIKSRSFDLILSIPIEFEHFTFPQQQTKSINLKPKTRH